MMHIEFARPCTEA